MRLRYPLDLLEETLRQKKKEYSRRKFSYAIPSLWLTEKRPLKAHKVNPFEYYLSTVKKIRRLALPRKKGKPTGGDWTRNAVVYNMFIRTTAAFDHNGNGSLDLPVNSQGFRETGTFLKAIAMLPYIKRLGANTIHLLPITSIGHDGNKGTLGSPYAIRNAYELDENQSEPLLGLDARTEFKAFVEAAHRMGFRVVLEFVFRTAAKDADWVKERPEWFYWIYDDIPPRDQYHLDESRYGSPIFSHEELQQIHRMVNEHRFDDLIPPHQTYREMFTSPPAPEAVEKVDGRYIGTLSNHRKVRVPGAFADWPPDDNQPPWGDVTYLRMYDHPGFNYIAYNTIRMYDGRLARPENINVPLWERIIGIIPYYQREFGIDGVMIDMGHALPMELKARMVDTARRIDPDFAFWDENFSITARSREEGYNAVFGFLWIDEHHPARMKSFCHRLAGEGFPISYFATPENHNTPRAATRPGGLLYARWSWVINNFIPAVPFIHSGFELAEEYPINTGLDFSAEQIATLPSEKLPLFSEYGYDWMRKDEWTSFVRKVALIRSRYRDMITNPDPRSFIMLSAGSDHVLAFSRVSSKKRLAILGSMNAVGNETIVLDLGTRRKTLLDLLSGRKLKLHAGILQAVLSPGQCMVFEV